MTKDADRQIWRHTLRSRKDITMSLTEWEPGLAKCGDYLIRYAIL